MNTNIYGMTVDAETGKTYWQKGSYVTVGDLVKHVKRHSKTKKHLVVYSMDPGGYLRFVEHMDKDAY
jgi:hypothetical protein